MIPTPQEGPVPVTPSKLSLVTLLTAATINAQVQTGRIVGTVFDPNHAVVPNATVAITNTGTDRVQNLITSSTGDFVLTPVDPGMYRVEVSAAGFESAVVNN